MSYNKKREIYKIKIVFVLLQFILSRLSRQVGKSSVDCSCKVHFVCDCISSGVSFLSFRYNSFSSSTSSKCVKTKKTEKYKNDNILQT